MTIIDDSTYASLFLAAYPMLIFIAFVTSLCYAVWSFTFTREERKFTRRTQFLLVTGIATAFGALGFEELFWYLVRVSQFPYVTPLIDRAGKMHTLPVAIVAMFLLWSGAAIHLYAFWSFFLGRSKRAAMWALTFVGISFSLFIFSFLFFKFVFVNSGIGL